MTAAPSIACPVCNAPAGEKCRSGAGRQLAHVHAARAKAAAPPRQEITVPGKVVAIERVACVGGGQMMVVTPAGLELVERLAAAGETVAGIAQTLRIGRRTFDEVRARQPEVVDALQRGQACDERVLASKLREAAMAGNVVAILACLNRQHSWRTAEGETAGPTVALQINLPGPLTAEQWTRAIDVPGKESDS